MLARGHVVDLRVPGVGHEPWHLLVVEDSAADAELVADCFEDPHAAGAFRLIRVERLASAVEHLSHTEVDCVLLDLSLPDSRGLATVRAVRDASPDVAIVVLTGLNEAAVGEAAIQLGAQDFLMKGELSARSLERSASYAIERQRQQVALRVAHAALTAEVATRELAEEQLRLSQDRLSAVLDNVSDIIAVIDSAGFLCELSPSAVRLLGWDRPAILGSALLKFVHPDDVEATRASLGRTVRLGTGVRPPLEIRLAATDGSWLPVEVVANNRLDDPAVAGIILSIRDVSERHDLQVARERLESEMHQLERLESQATLIDLTVTGVGQEGWRLLVVEDSAADAELVADCFEDPATAGAFHLTCVERLAAAVEHLSHTGVDCVLLDLSLPDSRGLDTVRAVRDASPDVAIVVLTGLNEAAVGEAAIQLGAQDFLVKGELTARTLQRSATYAIERQRQQLALRAAHAAVSEADARFQRAFDSAPIGMAVLALDGRFMEVNAALCEMVDHLEPQLLSISIREMLHADDLDAFDAVFNRLGRGELARLRTEYRLVGRDDRQVWALVVAATVDDADGRPAYVIVQVEDITAHKDAEARLVHQTLHDPLTGLPNRVLLQDRLEHVLARLDRRSESVGVFYLDLDRFKLINDTLGHEYGDRVIAEIGRRLSVAVRPSDTVARLGGDEFIVLAEDLSGRNEASAMADRLRAAVATPIRFGGADLVPSVSVGVALATGRHCTPEQLLREADTAMYSAKQRGRDRFEMFDDALRVRATQRLATEALIRRAIDGEQVVVVYQPLIDLTTSTVVGLEALMRIDNPPQGLLQPKDFLSTAEDTGLIVPIGKMVLTKAVETAARWLEHGTGTPFKVNVNLSARQLGLPGLAEDIALILETNAVPAQHLALELTETILIDAAASTIRGLTRLKELGVGLGIDDFGPGYSSLTYLRRFPVDFVKIDTTFVAGLPDNHDDEAIVKAVISLGHALGLTTIAEGVETQAQLDMLRAFGCDLAQGYLLGAPQLPDRLAAVRGDTADPERPVSAAE